MAEVEKKEMEELDKIYDYYYEVVKPAANDPNVSQEEQRKLFQKYHKMKADKEAQILARKIGIEEGKVKTVENLEKNEVFKKKREELEKQEKERERERKVNPPPSKSSSEAKDKAGLALFVGFIIATIVTLFGGIIILNWYLLIPGFIMFGILVIIASLGQTETGHASYYYAWGAGRGRAWRMSAAHRANK